MWYCRRHVPRTERRAYHGDTHRISATREIEGRDSVGLYLDEIARTPLLDAATEVELSKTIEAGLMAEHLLAEGRVGRKKGGAPMTRHRGGARVARRGGPQGRRARSSTPTCGWWSPSPASTAAPRCRCST